MEFLELILIIKDSQSNDNRVSQVFINIIHVIHLDIHYLLTINDCHTLTHNMIVQTSSHSAIKEAQSLTILFTAFIRIG